VEVSSAAWPLALPLLGRDSVATIEPGKTVAIGGYNIRVRLVEGSTAVFEITRR